MAKENNTEKYAVWCDIEMAFISHALTYKSADKSRDKHVRKTGHPKNKIHIKFPKLLKL